MLSSRPGSFVVTLITVISAVALMAAQESKGTANARAEVARGQKAFEANDYGAAEAAFRKAVELDPAWPEAHSSYQLAVRYVAGAKVAEEGGLDKAIAAKYLETVRVQYEKWVRAHPKNAGYLWAYADVLAEADAAKAENLCNEAVARDPAFAPAYRTLARIARLRGDVTTQLTFLQKTWKAAPDNPKDLLSYINALWPADPTAARMLALQFIERFPSDPARRGVLMDLGGYADDLPAKIRYFEQVKHEFGTLPPLLFDLYAQTDPAKALALAREMATRKPSGQVEEAGRRIWADVVALEEAGIRARALIDDKRFSEAVAVLQAGPSRSPGFRNTANWTPASSINRELALLTAEAEAGLGQGDRAYSRVMDAFIREPGDRLHTLLSRYGHMADKSRAAVDDDVRARLVAGATPAPDFPISTYPDGRMGSLSDLRGRVVLLNFWFPT